MSLTQRLLNIARAELRSAVDKLMDDADPDINAIEAELWEMEQELRETRASLRHEVPPDVCRFYANLELPIGATSDEVRAAYRRLMRRYHPDRHHGDDAKAKVANQLAQRLRAAHDGLLAYLDK